MASDEWVLGLYDPIDRRRYWSGLDNGRWLMFPTLGRALRFPSLEAAQREGWRFAGLTPYPINVAIDITHAYERANYGK